VWTEDRRPAAWVTELEPEFDVNERDSWYALEELRAAICPRCGNFRAICSTPGGVTGAGYNIRQEVCYPSAALEMTQRRIAKRFEKTTPDMRDGSLPTDGVLIAVTLTPDDSEDVLGLAAPDSFAEQAPGEQDEATEQA
jgi:hypothetical protein